MEFYQVHWYQLLNINLKFLYELKRSGVPFEISFISPSFSKIHHKSEKKRFLWGWKGSEKVEGDYQNIGV